MLLDAIRQMRLIVNIAFDDGSPLDKAPVPRGEVIKTDRSIARGSQRLAAMGANIASTAHHENTILVAHFLLPRPAIRQTANNQFGFRYAPWNRPA
jgi:hypothetical protein